MVTMCACRCWGAWGQMHPAAVPAAPERSPSCPSRSPGLACRARGRAARPAAVPPAPGYKEGPDSPLLTLFPPASVYWPLPKAAWHPALPSPASSSDLVSGSRHADLLLHAQVSARRPIGPREAPGSLLVRPGAKIRPPSAQPHLARAPPPPRRLATTKTGPFNSIRKSIPLSRWEGQRAGWGGARRSVGCQPAICSPSSPCACLY